MSPTAQPVYEDLGAGRARLVLVAHLARQTGLCTITWFDRADGVRVIDHTFVPFALNGQGLAGQLTQAALDQARADRMRVVAHCSYVAAWIKRHREYQDLLCD